MAMKHPYKTMTTYVILVRGVSPSGKNKLPMARFRTVLEQAGFDRVRTYIQSGNALVDTELRRGDIETSVSQLIRDHIGPDLTVIVRTGDELAEVLEANPFRNGIDISRVFFVSFAQPPPAQKAGELRSMDYSPEKLAFGKNAAYMFIPGVYGRGKLSGMYLEKKLGVSATMRNFNTMTRLIALSRERPGQKKNRLRYCSTHGVALTSKSPSLRRRKHAFPGSLRRRRSSGPPLHAILPGVFDRSGGWRIPAGAQFGLCPGIFRKRGPLTEKMYLQKDP